MTRVGALLCCALLGGCPVAGESAPERPAPPEAGSRPDRAAPPEAGSRPDRAAPSEAGPAPPLTPAQVHASALVVDTHNDVALRIIDDESFHFGRRNAEGHSDLVRMAEGGLDAVFLAVWVKPRLFRGEARWRRAVAMIDAIEATAAKNRDRAVLARSAQEVRAAARGGKIALLIGVEGAHALGSFEEEEQTLSRIRELRRRGVRYMTLTWTNSNPLAGSSGDRGRDQGLTPLGRRAVALMNEIGMIVDISHVSDATALEVARLSKRPVIASHSAVAALSDHPRNVSDEILTAVANNGGAVCINFYSGFLDHEWMAARREARSKGVKMARPAPPLSLLVDHMDHAIKVAGPDHVCLGSDFDGIVGVPQGMEDVSRLPALTEALAARGYSEATLRKVLGENVLRVLAANE